MAVPQAGRKAPAFKLPASTGGDVALKDFKGRNVVLYFYPKDDTPGCTTEACGFRDIHKKVQSLNAAVLGISPDSVRKHGKFIEKYSLPFFLLSDEDKKVCKSYGVWVKKKMYGREYMGVARTTFLIDKDGKIARVFEKVKPKAHAEEVLQALKTIA